MKVMSGVQISTKFGDSESAVRKMESSFRMRNVSISMFLTCILPRFMRNAILLKR